MSHSTTDADLAPLPLRIRSGLSATLLAVVAVTPLPFGSVEPSWVVAIQLSAAALGLGVLWVAWKSPDARLTLPRNVVIGAVLFAGVLLLQIVPIPVLSETLAPNVTRHAREALTRIEPSTVAGLAPMSASPPDSVDAALRVVAYGVAAAVAAVLLGDPASRRRLAWALAGLGAFEAMYGAAEYLSGHQHIFGYPKRYYLDEATGTFINRNHFASYLAMTLPFALALAVRSTPTRPAGATWRERALRLARGNGLTATVAAGAAAFIWIGVFLSYSRGGLLAAIVATVVFAMGTIRRRRTALRIAATAVLPAFALLWLAVRAPGERFLDLPAEADSGGINRLMVAKTSLSLLEDEPIFGYGLGTFESIFRLRKPLADRFVFDHAHNEPLQFVLEGGIVALAAGSIWLAGLLRARRAAWRWHLVADPTVHAAWAGLAAIGVHSFVDFPLRIPGIALMTGVLLGVVLRAASASNEHATEAVAPVSAFPECESN